MKVTDYKIVRKDSWAKQGPRYSLEFNVLTEIRNGWQLLGGPFVDKDGEVGQAMVKYEKHD